MLLSQRIYVCIFRQFSKIPNLPDTHCQTWNQAHLYLLPSHSEALSDLLLNSARTTSNDISFLGKPLSHFSSWDQAVLTVLYKIVRYWCQRGS